MNHVSLGLCPYLAWRKLLAVLIRQVRPKAVAAGRLSKGRSRGSRSPIVRFSWDDIRARHSARSENEFKISQIRWIACEHSLGHSCLFERSHHRRIASSDHLSRFSLSPNRQVRPTPLCWLFLAFLPVVCVFRVLVSVDHLRSGSLLPTPWPGLSLERST